MAALFAVCEQGISCPIDEEIGYIGLHEFYPYHYACSHQPAHAVQPSCLVLQEDEVEDEASPPDLDAPPLMLGVVSRPGAILAGGPPSGERPMEPLDEEPWETEMAPGLHGVTTLAPARGQAVASSIGARSEGPGGGLAAQLSVVMKQPKANRSRCRSFVQQSPRLPCEAPSAGLQHQMSGCVRVNRSTPWQDGLSDPSQWCGESEVIQEIFDEEAVAEAQVASPLAAVAPEVDDRIVAPLPWISKVFGQDLEPELNEGKPAASEATFSTADTEPTLLTSRCRQSCEPLRSARKPAAGDVVDNTSRLYKLRQFLAANGFAGVSAKKLGPFWGLSRSFAYPLHAAVRTNDSEAVEVLLWAGSDRLKEDSQRLTALKLAHKLNMGGSHSRAIKLLSTS